MCLKLRSKISPEDNTSSNPPVSSSITVISPMSLMFSEANYPHYGDLLLEFTNGMVIRIDFDKATRHISHMTWHSLSVSHCLLCFDKV